MNDATPTKPTLCWNAGGFFGALLGATSWMLISALMLFQQDTTLALQVLAIYTLSNGAGIGLWLARGRLSAHTGLQSLLILLALASFAIVALIDSAGLWEAIQWGSSVSANQTYVFMALLWPFIMFIIARSNKCRVDATVQGSQPSEAMGKGKS